MTIKDLRAEYEEEIKRLTKENKKLTKENKKLVETLEQVENQIIQRRRRKQKV